MTYVLGPFNFDDLHGTVVLPTKAIDLETRVGQDGLVAFEAGTRGVPFQLRSRFYLNTWLSAVQLANNYTAAVSLNLHNIIRLTEDYAATVWRFMIINVDVMPIASNIHWYGRRSGVPTSLTPAYCVEAIWTLVAIDTSLILGDPTPPPPEDPDPPPPP